MTEITFRAITLDIRSYGLVSPKGSRKEAVDRLIASLVGTRHTLVERTLQASRRRRFDGRYLPGWAVTVRVIVDGQDYDLGLTRALPNPSLSDWRVPVMDSVR